MNAFLKRIVPLAVGAMLVGAVPASAQRHGDEAAEHRGGHLRGSFWYGGPYYWYGGWGPWGPWYPGSYAYVAHPYSDVKTDVTPKDAAVYVDGYYAGRAADYDGVFKRLHVAPGGHAITFYLPGFKTVTQQVYVRPDSTLKMKADLEHLPAGKTSAPVPTPERPRVREGTR